jgi:casein kinase II subunit beta
MSEEFPWIDWFLDQPFGQYFVRIDANFLDTPFNLYGIAQKVAHFQLALNLIRGNYITPTTYPTTFPEHLNDYGIILYGLIHARYLVTAAGQDRMKEKYDSMSFETCPRTLCNGIQCLPYGDSDTLGNSTLKKFCPNCGRVYHLKGRDCESVDGSFFGPNWVPVFLQRYSDLVPAGPPQPYEPRLFGYQIERH